MSVFRSLHNLSHSSQLPTKSSGSLILNWSAHPWPEIDLEVKSFCLGGRGNEKGTGLGFRYNAELKKKAKIYRDIFLTCRALEHSCNLDSDSVGGPLHQQRHSGLYQSATASFGHDITEVENFCRIHRLAEELHLAVMSVLRRLGSLGPGKQPDAQVSEVGYTFSNDKSSKDEAKDVQGLEEKVLASLACLGALLQEERLKLFANYTENLLSFQKLQPSNEDKQLSRLASFRAKMLNLCNLLQVELESLLFPFTGNNAEIYRSLQGLENACLDAGLQRLKGTPCSADIPNFKAVRWQSQVVGDNEDIAFWRGGQVTEEGLQWLIGEGFKTIVDLRAERTESMLPIETVVRLGEIKHVIIPVPSQSVPSTEQVEEFARLVSKQENRPLFLQSRGGLGRTIAMVSKWREVCGMYCCLKPRGSVGIDNLLSVGKEKAVSLRSDSQNKIYKSENSLLAAKESFHQDCLEENLTLVHTLSSKAASRDITLSADSLHAKSNVMTLVNSTVTQVKGQSLRTKGKYAISPDEPTISMATEKPERSMDLNACLLESAIVRSPFESQRPRPTILLKKLLGKPLKGKIMVPKNFESVMKRESVHLSVTTGKEYSSQPPNASKVATFEDVGDHNTSQSTPKMTEDKGMSTQQLHSIGEHKFSDAGRNDENARLSQKSLGNQEQISSHEDELIVPDLGGPTKTFQASERGNTNNTAQTDTETEIRDEVPSSLGGDMCASKTGVVRLQSRKKAEMYLVRTDGVSCTREKVEDSALAFTHPSTQQQMLMWNTMPRTALLLKKLGDELMDATEKVASFLYYEEQMNVMVEPEVHDRLARHSGFGFVQTFYSQDTSKLHESVDFVVCLGGDGVILHASNLFRTAVPPIVSFNLGSLGFLTAHPFEDFKQDLRAIIHGNNRCEGVYLTLRMRLLCELLRNGIPVQGKVFEALNEVVVDRGSSPYLSKIECYERNRLVTKVQADGVIIATPTGSTAYSTAAGGSMVHPNVPCILFTPICPHSLSSRPVIFPDSAVLELKVPDDARSNAWVSFDGKKRQQLFHGDSVRVSMSRHPLPTVNKSDQTDDWFRSLIRCLNWNGRLEQKPLSS